VPTCTHKDRVQRRPPVFVDGQPDETEERVSSREAAGDLRGVTPTRRVLPFPRPQPRCIAPFVMPVLFSVGRVPSSSVVPVVFRRAGSEGSRARPCLPACFCPFLGTVNRMRAAAAVDRVQAICRFLAGSGRTRTSARAQQGAPPATCVTGPCRSVDTIASRAS